MKDIAAEVLKPLKVSEASLHFSSQAAANRQCATALSDASQLLFAMRVN